MRKKFKEYMDKFLGRPPKPIEVKKICAVIGEIKPGYLIVDVQTYNESGEVIGYPTDRVNIRISPKIRAIVNRILMDEHTDNDMEILTRVTVKNL